MSSRPPPVLATWLLERLCADSRSDSLIGDLAEQFGEGRSRAWYWRQVTGALMLDVVRALRAHAASFTAAVLAGCALTSLWQRAISFAFEPIYRNLGYVSAHPWSVESLLRVAGVLANSVSICALYFATAWVATRVHRAHRRAVLVALVIVLTAQRLPGIARLAVDAAADSRFATFMGSEIVTTALQAVFTLVEGLWAIRTERFAEMDLRTRRVAILVLTVALLVTLVYAARRVGALPYALPAWYVLDVLYIAAGAYLALLLWRRSSGPRITRHPQPLAGPRTPCAIQQSRVIRS